MTPKEKTLIAGLGRGLIVKSTHCDTVGILTCVDFFTNYVEVTENKELYALKITQCKPYLRDLSDLDKEIEQDGQSATLMDIIFDECWFPEDVPAYIERIKSKDITVKEWELLSDWHFNVFNLPETDYIKVTPENNPY